MCNTYTSEIHIELISLRNNGENRVEHYGEDFDEKCSLGLVKGYNFINDYTELTSYCLENYEEVKDITYFNKNYKTNNGKYKKCNGRFIKAFLIFKMLIDTGDKLITPMGLTDEALNTQFHDKVGDSKTLHYNERGFRLEEHQYNTFFGFETITSEYKHMPYLCCIYNDDIQQEL